MRYCLFSIPLLVNLVLAGPVAAQQSSVSETSSNGHKRQSIIEGPAISRTTTANGSVTTETLQSINGRSVPMERVTERVLRDDASGRVVERRSRATIRRATPHRR